MAEYFQTGLMIGAPSSGCGKTIVTLGLLRALHDRGLDIRAAKAGPDYIDPGFHQIACGVPSVNLDPWAMSMSRCRQLARTQGGSHLLVEAAMGLFDGSADGRASGADLAVGLGINVLLVVDASSQSQSIAALVCGFRDFREDVNVVGVLLNKVASVRHELMLRRALKAIDMPVLGAIGKQKTLKQPSRHLGLVQAGESDEIENFVKTASEIISSQCDLDAIENLFVGVDAGMTNTRAIVPPGQRVAIARDVAFSFIYPHLVADWRKAGAEVSFFSPLLNEGPKKDCDAIFLPGGYPELHAGKISAANNFHNTMQRKRDQNALIYAECGGYMVLGHGITGADGVRYNMLGLLNLETSFETRKLHLGYRRAKSNGGFFAGDNINGHEFHYTSAIKQEGQSLFTLVDAMGDDLGEAGLRSQNVMGSYLHMIDVDCRDQEKNNG